MRAARTRLVALAALCFVAAILPWVVDSALTPRLLGLPFAVIGVVALYATSRVPRPRPVSTANFPLLAQGGGCACGGEGCCGGGA